jgi:hypothetical protein
MSWRQYLGFFYWRCEEFIREERKRAAEDDSGVVARLQSRDQHGVFTDSMGVLKLFLLNCGDNSLIIIYLFNWLLRNITVRSAVGC